MTLDEMKTMELAKEILDKLNITNELVVNVSYLPKRLKAYAELYKQALAVVNEVKPPPIESQSRSFA
jgi:hypothetical protein